MTPAAPRHTQPHTYMIATITTNHTIVAELVSRKDGYSTRYWIIKLNKDVPLSRPLKKQLAVTFGFIAELTAFHSLVDGVLTLHEDLMN